MMMDKVNIKRAALLEKVEENRAKHKSEYDEAAIGYREEAVAKLTEALEAAKGDGEIITYLGLTVPMSHLDDYDQIITMLQKSVDDVRELENHDFSRYVMDNWEWKQQFSTANTLYASSNRRIK
jgi:hypothetical protein